VADRNYDSGSRLDHAERQLVIRTLINDMQRLADASAHQAADICTALADWLRAEDWTVPDDISSLDPERPPARTVIRRYCIYDVLRHLGVEAYPVRVWLAPPGQGDDDMLMVELPDPDGTG
jgi:hypothetical protein